MRVCRRRASRLECTMERVLESLRRPVLHHLNNRSSESGLETDRDTKTGDVGPRVGFAGACSERRRTLGVAPAAPSRRDVLETRGDEFPRSLSPSLSLSAITGDVSKKLARSRVQAAFTRRRKETYSLSRSCQDRSKERLSRDDPDDREMVSNAIQARRGRHRHGERVGLSPTSQRQARDFRFSLGV